MMAKTPCVIYHRLRPDCPDASRHARTVLWPEAERIALHQGYRICGLYGDTEVADRFCGHEEFRSGFDAALLKARELADEQGACTVLVAYAGSIGGFDPFIPDPRLVRSIAPVHIALAHFHLRPHALTTTLRSAWAYMDECKTTVERRLTATAVRTLSESCSEPCIMVQLKSSELRADLYLANPSTKPIQWSHRVQMQEASEISYFCSSKGWSATHVAPNSSAYLGSVLQGEPGTTRLFEFRGSGDKRYCRAHVLVTRAKLSQNSIPIVWS